MMNPSLRTLILASALPLALLGGASAEDRVPMPAERLAKTVLCTDGKSHYVAIAPGTLLSHELFYGDDKRFSQIPPPPPRTLGGLYFRDSRVVSKTGNPDFRGIDVREYSEVELDVEKNHCAVRCGDRVTKLSIVAPEKAQSQLKAAVFVPSPQQYKPYALARDDRGTYYYVDKGMKAPNQRSFRLFVGPKGALAPAKMTNIVSDSEGDIFSTVGGDVRLILDKQEPAWIENEKSRKLTLVPVDQNMHMIYTDLGVYSGQLLGTPCDHL